MKLQSWLTMPLSGRRANRTRKVGALCQAVEDGRRSFRGAIGKKSRIDRFNGAWADLDLSTELQPYLRVIVDRTEALYAAWYEFFPRSAEGKPNAGSKFRDCLSRIDDAKAMVSMLSISLRFIQSALPSEGKKQFRHVRTGRSRCPVRHW